MLHMVIIKHTAESCPGRPGNEDVIPCLNQAHETFTKKSIKTIGRWADPPGHVNYLVLDAENAHQITEVLMESGLIAHTTAEIRPVFSMD